jgi:hypothetical protein
MTIKISSLRIISDASGETIISLPRLIATMFIPNVHEYPIQGANAHLNARSPRFPQYYAYRTTLNSLVHYLK